MLRPRHLDILKEMLVSLQRDWGTHDYLLC